MTWNLEEGLDLIRQLAPVLLEVGWGLGLTGSVLIRGASANDLDVIVYPQNNGLIDRGRLYIALQSQGMVQAHDVDVVHKAWRRQKSTDCKHVEVWKTPSGARFDLFILA